MKLIISGKIIQKLSTNSDMKTWWKHRDASLHYSLKSIKTELRIPHIIEDAAVPLVKMSKIFVILKNIERKYKVKTIIYGHIGNGNIHVRLISKRKNTKMVKNIAIEYFNEVIKNKGNISAENGDGLASSEFIKKQYGVTNYQTFKKIKQVLDPDYIINPGKIITEKSTIVKNLKKY